MDWTQLGQNMEALAEELKDIPQGPPDYVLFGTEEYPIRCSSLTSLQSCDYWWALKWQENYDMTLRSPGGKACDNGTGVGFAIELFHRGVDMDAIMPKVELASKGLMQNKEPFPNVDLGEVRRVLAHYVRDPRNPRDAVVTSSLEQEVRLELEPHPTDPTGKRIYFKGHLDQIRETPAGLFIWDLKHSRFAGRELVQKYSWQQACYSLAATATLGRPVGWGGIIATKGYLTRAKRDPGTQAVFYPSGWTLNHCRDAMNVVRLFVARIRSGQFAPTPGTFCTFCPRGDFQSCSEDFQ